MEQLDLEHYRICLSNNHSLQDKIDGLIHESFEDYCHRKNIIYNDKDLKNGGFQRGLFTIHQLSF